MVNILSIVSVVFFLAACERQVVFERNKEERELRWHTDEGADVTEGAEALQGGGAVSGGLGRSGSAEGFK